MDEKKSDAVLTPEMIRAFVLAASDAKAEKETITKRVWMMHREQGVNNLFETFDAKSGACIHINCLAREEPTGEEGQVQEKKARPQKQP